MPHKSWCDPDVVDAEDPDGHTDGIAGCRSPIESAGGVDTWLRVGADGLLVCRVAASAADLATDDLAALRDVIDRRLRQLRSA